MAKKDETILIQEGDIVIELTGVDKQAYLEQRAKDQAEADAFDAKRQEELELKKSAYTKLGLTEEEIEAII
jgi:hypothetical protein